MLVIEGVEQSGQLLQVEGQAVRLQRRCATLHDGGIRGELLD